jgi:hypothetical protein
MGEITAAVAEWTIRLFRLASMVAEVIGAGLLADFHNAPTLLQQRGRYALDNLGSIALGLVLAVVLALVVRRVMAASGARKKIAEQPGQKPAAKLTDRIRQRLELLMEGEGEAGHVGYSGEEKEGSPYSPFSDQSSEGEHGGGRQDDYDSYHALEDIYGDGSQPDEGLQGGVELLYADDRTLDYTTDAGYQDDDDDEDSAKTDARAIEHQRVMYKSTKDPRVLIGWRVSVRGLGTGLVLGTVRKTFCTTKLLVRMEQDDSEVALALQRSPTKGTVPFALIEKVGIA